MSLQFFDGFETSDANTFLEKWTYDEFGSIMFESNQGRDSSRNCLIDQNFRIIFKTVEPRQAMIAGVAWQPRSGMSSFGTIMTFQYEGSPHVNIRAQTDGRISVHNNTTQRGITTDPVLLFDEYNFVEARAFISDSVGAVEVRVNNGTVLNLTGIDTNWFGLELIDEVGFSGHPGGGGARLDAIYILNEDGAGPLNTFLGNVQVDTLLPNANGDLTGIPTLFPAGGSAYEKVDDALADGETSYLESTAVNQISTFTFPSLPVIPGGALIHGVQFGTRVRKTTSGSRNVRVLQRVAAVNSTISQHSVPVENYITHLDLLVTNPVTGFAFSDADINALQLGLEVL